MLLALENIIIACLHYIYCWLIKPLGCPLSCNDWPFFLVVLKKSHRAGWFTLLLLFHIFIFHHRCSWMKISRTFKWNHTSLLMSFMLITNKPLDFSLLLIKISLCLFRCDLAMVIRRGIRHLAHHLLIPLLFHSLHTLL